MDISISDNYEFRIFFTYFYIISSDIGWVVNNHVGFNGVNFVKYKRNTFSFANPSAAL